MWLRQSTASQEIKLGPFVDSTDGNTQETGLTIANTDIKLTKHGATTEANKNSGGATHIANGRYYAVLDATDTNTLGNLEVDCHPTGALPSHRDYMVVPANVFDSVILGTDTLTVDVIQWLGTAAATPTTAGVPEVDVTYVSGTAQTANDNGADINAILVDTNSLNDTKIPDTISLAAINAEIDTALTDYGANTVVPDAAGTAPTAVEIRTEIDSNSTQLAAILADTVSLGITKNATFSNFEFLMVDSTDFATPETGLTVTGQRSIDGAAFAGVTGVIAEVGSGIYQFDAAAADTNGDVITWKFSSAGAADRFVTFKTRS